MGIALMFLRPMFLKSYFITVFEDLACEVHRVTHGRRDGMALMFLRPMFLKSYFISLFNALCAP